jgi:hypothetical protein
MIDPSWGPFNRFNARRSTPAEVAEDFIAPDHYVTLRDTIHPQLVIGPRGIGKTTLLKMLLPEAIDSWEGPDADEARRRIGFTGVFVAADKMWAGQFNQLADPLVGDAIRAGARRVFGWVAFSYMALSSFAAAAAYRCRRDGDPSGFRWVEMAPTQEEQLCAEIAEIWSAHPATASFESLANQMANNVAKLGQLMFSAGSPGLSIEELSELLKSDLLKIDFFSAVTRFIGAFNHAVGQENEPWVLLIDEFEFLPPAARVELGDGFQGRDPRLSYKISLAPYTGLSPFSGTELDDWASVRIHPPANPANDRFTNALFEGQIRAEIKDLGRLDKALPGRGFESGRRNSFRPPSRNARDIERLASVDPGFKKWLEKVLKKRELADVATDDHLLKPLKGTAMELVRLRLQYRDKDGRVRKRDGTWEKVLPIYGGLRNLYAMTEGNPRWIKALANALLESRSKESRVISAAQQARAIDLVVHTLYNKLKAVNIETSSGHGGTTELTRYVDYTPILLLDALGRYLSDKEHSRPFNPKLPGTFVNDIGDDAWVKEIVDALVFLGAIIIERPGSEEGLESFRLARMWGPIYRILPRGGEPESLQRILDSKAARRLVDKSRPGKRGDEAP